MVGETRNEFLNNTNGKLEIIQKDIGYSSDADMSDAVEVKTNYYYNHCFVHFEKLLVIIFLECLEGL